MITLKELLTSPCNNKEHLENLEDLLVKINRLRVTYGKPLKVTSGYRSIEDHLRIYKEKGITDKTKIPMQSNHLKGLAVDLVPLTEPIEKLHAWILHNYADKDLWFEDFSISKNWLHAQIIPPKSGSKFFKP